MPEIIKPTYDDYVRISDVVFSIGLNTVLKFNTSLVSNVNDKRTHFHNEYQYDSKISNRPDITIKRNFDYYMSIENIVKPEHENKAYIRIGVVEITKLINAIDEAVSWFNDAKYANLFAMKNGKLFVTNPKPEIILKDLPMNKYLRINPIVMVTRRDSENISDQEPGVIIFLSSDANYVEVTLDRLIGLQYSLKTFNMYLSAQAMLNYIGRPDFGNHMTSFYTGVSGRDYTPEEDPPTKSKIEGRMPTSQRSISSL